MPETNLALLRGINVGGKNMLPMKDLGAMFLGAGCLNVRTYIQSGNVIFDADSDLAALIPGIITARIAERFGHRVPVIVRSAAQCADVLRNNPFIAEGVAEESLYVMYLAEYPTPGCIEKLDPDRSPPDAFVLRGQEIYLRLPNGAARSKLTNQYFDTKLATISTARNWRTATTLCELMKS
jgi:uncharacterized protein (DUF1697 family)